MKGERKIKKRIEQLYDDAFRHGVSQAVTMIISDERIADKALDVIYENKDIFKAATLTEALYDITGDGRWLSYKTYKDFK